MVEPEDIDVPDFVIENMTIEQKFQHFLNATVRQGSVYGVCAGYPAGTWSWDNDGHWIVRRRPQILFACVCLGASFLAYWYNFNEDSEHGWMLSTGPGIHYTFHEEIAKHTLDPSRVTAIRRRFGRWSNERWNRISQFFRGYREFVDDDASEQSFYWGDYYVSRIGTIADYINEGSLRFVRKVGLFYDFKWDPSIFNDFNVLCIGGHHVILYIKRGEEGENDPPSEDDTHNQIWRLAADGSDGTPTTWREEVLRVRICPNGNPHHTTHGDTEIQTVTLSPDAEETNMTTINGWLRNQHLTLSMEIPGLHWKRACSSIIAIWKLKNLRSNGRAPLIPSYTSDDNFLDNPARRIEITPPRGGSIPVSIPTLTDIRVMKQADGDWEPVQGETPVRSGDNVKLIIESTGVDTGTPITIEIFDYDGYEKLPFGEGETTGNTTEIEAELLNFIVPNPPNNQIYFLASIYDQELFIESDWIHYLENP